MNKGDVPTSVFTALSGSKYHFVTHSGDIIPLLSITNVRVVGKSTSPRFDMDLWDGDVKTFGDLQPQGSIAVQIAGFSRGTSVSDEVVVEAFEVPKFVEKLESLRGG